MVKIIEISDELYERLRDFLNIFEEILKKVETKTELKPGALNRVTNNLDEIELIGNQVELLKKQIEIIDALIKKADAEGKTNIKIELLKKQIELMEKLKLEYKEAMQLKKSKQDSMTIEPITGDLMHFDPIMQITTQNIARKLPNGTIIRGRFRGQNYETQINSSVYKYNTLNAIYIKEFNASVNIWREKIYFKDDKGWWPLRTLRDYPKMR